MKSLCRRGAWFLPALVLYAGALSAQNRTYTLGTTVNFAAGGSNQVSGAAVQPLTSFSQFYGTAPSLMFSSAGRHTSLSASYAYGFNRYQTGSGYDDQSHTGSLGFNWTLSRAFKFTVSDAFHVSADSTSFNAIRGVTSDSEPPSSIVFSPVAYQTSSRSNSASIRTEYTVDDHSTLSLSLSHSLLSYSTIQNTAAAAALPSSQSFSGDFSYLYRTGKAETWTMGYSASYFDIGQYQAKAQVSTPLQNVYSQSVRLNYSNQVIPGVTVGFGAGLSEVSSVGTAGKYTGYNAMASLGRKVGTKSSMSLHFSQNSGDSSGLGSISSTRSGGLSLNYATKAVTLMGDLSVFDTQGTLDNGYAARGGAATANIGFPISTSWSLQTGATYQRYGGSSLFNFAQKHVFMTLRYTKPSLWKAAR